MQELLVLRSLINDDAFLPCVERRRELSRQQVSNRREHRVHAGCAHSRVARDADQKTAEFLLSRPVSRHRILLTRWTVTVVLVCLPVYLTSISAIWISLAVDEKLSWSDVLLSSTFMALFLVMLVTFTTLISSLSSYQLRAGIILIGLMLLSFAFYLIQEIDSISLFKTIDVFVFMDIQAGKLPWTTAGSFLLATVVMLYASLWVYARRDF